MITSKINIKSGNGFIRLFSTGNVEKVNPFEFLKEYEIKKRALQIRDDFGLRYPRLESLLSENHFIGLAEKSLNGYFEAFINTDIHPNFINLITTAKKKHQIKLLKGMSLTPDQLLCWILKAFNDFGFLYSTYRFENLPKGVKGKTLPKLFWQKDDNSVEVIGKTDMKPGELKNLNDQRTVFNSHFIENNSLWHCIFITYESIKGKESWKGGQPHFHYFSSSFGISKNQFMQSMESGKYLSTSVHIELLDYGVQPNEKTMKE